MRYPQAISRWIIFAFAISALLLVPSWVIGGTPHVIYGKVFNEDGGVPSEQDLEIYAYIHERPDEILSKSSVGCGYGLFSNEGWLWLEGGNYPTPWSIGEDVRIIAIAVDSLQQTASIDLVLNSSGNQIIPDLQLQTGDHVGPIAFNAIADGANPLSIPEGTGSITLTATLSDGICGNSDIIDAEYFVDTDPGFGSGGGMSASDGVFDSILEDVNASVDTSSWTEGSVYTLYVRGQDAAGNWGTANSVVVSVEAGVGPIPGDLNNDGCVDQKDLDIILAARNTPATGPDDPRDLDGDGMITALDARKLVLLCTNPRCASCQ